MMNKRIDKLTKLTLEGKMYVEPVKTSFDRMDLFLSKQEMEVKRICEYIQNQEPIIEKYCALTGFFNFDDSVVGDIFRQSGGHKHTTEMLGQFYCKHIDNLSSMDWQHGTSDYRNVLTVGMRGIVEQIEESIRNHTDAEKIEFLTGLKKIAETLILWMKKCSAKTLEVAKHTKEEEYRENLKKLSNALLNISEGAPESFYEAVLTIYVCFSLNPDSFGTLDRYLSKFYFADIKEGNLTKKEAKEYLQELYLMVQAATPFSTKNFTKGGQSHFCIGGRNAAGEDCYNEVSELILESLIELPTYVPQISLRWTNDTPKEVFRHVLECERKDKNKRIAFTNDDRRIEAYTKICSIPYEEAINYTLVGCNEPAMLGGMCASTSHGNMAHSVETTMHQRSDEIIKCKSFDEFYDIFHNQLYADLDKIYYYDDLYNIGRGKDINYVSCLLLNGCIENGKSITRGGVKYAVSTIMFLGNVTLIDSLSVVKQFVFDEKIVTMDKLVMALRNNWEGYEGLRQQILKRGNFFGNDDDTSNYVAKKLYDDIYEYIKDKKTVYGYPVLLGDHTGYPMHFKWFGEQTKATPDGRKCGEALSYGIFQTNGKDRNGLTALMNSISKFDTHGISSATVTNFSLDTQYNDNDENFEKTADLLETYFKNGGIHFQLNYISKEDLLRAKKNPEEYGSLRVRVTGYSEFYTRLDEPVQDSILKRYQR